MLPNAAFANDSELYLFIALAKVERRIPETFAQRLKFKNSLWYDSVAVVANVLFSGTLVQSRRPGGGSWWAYPPIPHKQSSKPPKLKRETL